MNDDGGPNLISFQQTSARQVLDKLAREIARINSSSGEPIRDHVTNAFWTAWHIHSWLWNFIHRDPSLKQAVLTYRGIDDEVIDDSASFGEALARRFVPLKICRMIALSPSEVEIHFGPGDTSDDRTSALASAGDNTHTPYAVSPQSTSSMPALVIMGRTVHASRLLKEVEEYWITLIHECGVEKLN